MQSGGNLGGGGEREGGRERKGGREGEERGREEREKGVRE